MPLINIFSDAEIYAFDNPPIFTGEERKKYFRLTKGEKEFIETLGNSSSKVGFALHLGYFKKSNRFYAAQNFNDADFKYVKNNLNIDGSTKIDSYNRKLLAQHKKKILELLGRTSFQSTETEFIEHLKHLVRHRMQPRNIIEHLQHWCEYHKSEMCAYFTVSRLITEEINAFEKATCLCVKENLSDSNKILLDHLLTESAFEGFYQLTRLKKIITEDSPNKIKESLKEFLKLKQYYNKLHPVIKALDLPVDTFKSYGIWLLKAQRSQLMQLQNPYFKYLHLISFIHFQFHFWQDAYVSILYGTANSYIRKAKNRHQDALKKQAIQEDATQNTSSEKQKTTEKKRWAKVFEIINNTSLSPEEKLSHIEIVAEEYKLELQKLEKKKESELQEEVISVPSYHDFLASFSVKMGNRMSGIIKSLIFDEVHSDEKFMKAVLEYQQYDQIIQPEIYTSLFKEEEKEALYDDKGRFSVGLCKSLFFIKVAEAIKSGVLNLKYSYKYLALDEYLISLYRWEKEGENLMAQAGLSHLKSAENVLEELREILESSYQRTHEQFVKGKNSYLKYTKEKRPSVKTPAAAPKNNKRMSDLFEDCHYVLVPQILSDIENATHFTSCFEHLNIKHKRQKPDLKVFLAALIGSGCNLGMGKMAKITKGVKTHSIQNTMNWYFSLGNLLKANDKVVEMIDKLALSDVFRKNPKLKHSSSDGQKFNVVVPSLYATHSSKYFHTGKGVSVYSFINDKFALFYNLVISASEREAAYVIDGLLHNNIAPLGETNDKNKDLEWQHSTDTHGFSEIIFGTTHFLNICFAPRIKNYQKQQIYGFEKPSYYKEKGYFWLPKRSINTELIISQWDNILRLITTIRLKEASASDIFRRLNSYSRQHPLYKALKEFGRIIKTIYLLRYINDLELRQQIQYQLNMVELSHKFADAVFFGKRGEFYDSSEEEQKVATASRVLIQNSIILWNYLYLSQKIVNCKVESELSDIMETIKEGSMISWQHVHMEGTYNLEEEFVSNFSTSQIARILDMDFEDFNHLKV